MTSSFALPFTTRKVEFPHSVLVAAGSFKTYESLKKVAKTDVIPVWGSITTEPSSGNGGRDYHATYEGNVLLHTQNSLGLPNPGMTYVETHARELIRMYNDMGKPLIINVSGNGIKDTLELLDRALACGFNVIEVNGACPNKPGHPMICQDTGAVDELFSKIESRTGSIHGTAVFWKVSLGMGADILAHNARAVARSNACVGIVTGNTLPNTRYLREDGSSAIMTANDITRGGMGGPAVRHLALSAIMDCLPLMPAGKVITGCGGIGSAAHARLFEHVGASMIQMQSAWREGGERPEIVRDILAELME